MTYTPFIYNSFTFYENNGKIKHLVLAFLCNVFVSFINKENILNLSPGTVRIFFFCEHLDFVKLEYCEVWIYFNIQLYYPIKKITFTFG